VTVSKLTLYNGALLECKERELASLSEDIAARRLLDRAWAASGGAIDFCLGQGEWRFATRTIELASTTSVTPDFGYRLAFEKPSDHVRTVKVCSDEYQQVPLLAYSQEQSYFFADIDPIYLSYVSNDASYGADYSLWSPEFVRYVELYLAFKIAGKLTMSEEDKRSLFQQMNRALLEAKASNAKEGPTVFPPQGAWVSARLGRGATRRDRGSRSSLVG
jgi:hypothetical protein